MSRSIGMMKFPRYGKIKHGPNHQPVPIVSLIPVEVISNCIRGVVGFVGVGGGFSRIHIGGLLASTLRMPIRMSVYIVRP